MTTTPDVLSKHTREGGGHWYHTDGRPAYSMPNASKPGQTRDTTLKDARALNLLPSVTTILKCLAKPALEAWKEKQIILAVTTTPQLPGESIDDYIERVIVTEKVHQQERDAAAKRGTAMHDALECAFHGKPVDPAVWEWCDPAYQHIRQAGTLAATERVLVGDGYAGRTDIVMETPEFWRIWDYKTCKTMPEKGAWPEHRLQLAAYGKAFLDMLPDNAHTRKIKVGNVYISTIKKGEFCVWETDDWFETYERGFRPLVKYWQFSTGHVPEQSK